MLTALWKNPHKIFILSCSSKLDSYSSNKPQRRLLHSLSQRYSQTFLQALLYSALPSAKISAPPKLFAAFILAYLCASGITIGEVKVSKCIHTRSCFNGKEKEYICYSKCKEYGGLCVCVFAGGTEWILLTWVGGERDLKCFQTEGNGKILDITPSIAFLVEGKWFYSSKCSPSLCLLSEKQSRDAFTSPVSPCAFRLSLPNWLHVSTRMWTGTAEWDQLSALCLLPAFPCCSTMPCSWADFWWLAAGGKNTQILFVAGKHQGVREKGVRFRLEEGENDFDASSLSE